MSVETGVSVGREQNLLAEVIPPAVERLTSCSVRSAL
jgi:hypothetical protein